MTMSVAGVLDGTLAARWSLGFEDLVLLNAKPAGTRLCFAAQLMMYRTTGRFGRAAGEFAGAAIAYLAEQIGVTAADLADYGAHDGGGSSRPDARHPCPHQPLRPLRRR